MPSHWETPPSSNSKCHGLEAWQWQLCQSIGLKNRVRWILEPVGQIVELEAKSIKILVEAHQMVHATDLRSLAEFGHHLTSLRPGLILSNQYDLVKEFCRDCMSQDSLGRVFNHIKISLAEYMRRLEALTYREDEDNTSSDEDLIETDSTEEGTGSQEEADDSSFEEEPPALVAKSKKRWADLVDDSDEEELPAWA
eukprot:g19461.t1